MTASIPMKRTMFRMDDALRKLIARAAKKCGFTSDAEYLRVRIREAALRDLEERILP